MAKHSKTKRIITLLLPFLAVLATIYTLYFAKTLFLPIVIAIFVALFGDPLVSRLEKLRVMRSVGTIIVMSTIIGILVAVVFMFKTPAQTWIDKLPEIASEMSHSITAATQSIDETPSGGANPGEQTQNASNGLQASTYIEILKHLAIAAPVMLAQVLATIFLIYFFLVYGQILLLRVVQVKDSFKDKRDIVELVTTIQESLSKYIFTITLINTGLGLTVGTAFYFLGVDDPFLWGALAGVLNFAPYIGPLISAAIFSLVAYIQVEQVEFVVLIAAVYLSINMIEAHFVTPTLLGSNLNLNPLVVFLWLLIWGWIWGAFGMLVGVPMLVCLSIYLEKSQIFGAWHILLKNTRD